MHRHKPEAAAATSNTKMDINPIHLLRHSWTDIQKRRLCVLPPFSRCAAAKRRATPRYRRFLTSISNRIITGAARLEFGRAYCRRMKIRQTRLARVTSNVPGPSPINITKQMPNGLVITQNGFVCSNHFSPPNLAPFITKIYTLLHLHFQNFPRKLEFLAMPSSFTARLITLTTIPVVSIIVVVVSGPV